MNVLGAMLCATGVAGVFAAIARQRLKGYGIMLSLRWPVSAVLFGFTAMGVALALRMNQPSVIALLIAIPATAICAWTDACTGIILDVVTLPALIAVVLATRIEGRLSDALLGVTVASGALLMIYALTRGRGLGLGDIKLAAVLGGAFGYLGAIEALGISFVSGAIVGVAQALIFREWHREVRFGPYLALGAFAILLRGAA